MDDFDLDDTYEFAVPNQLKTAEEIKKFAIDESFTPIQRFNHILDCCQEVQVLSVIYDLESLFKSTDPKQHEAMCKKLAKMIPKYGEETCTIAAATLPKLLQNKCVTMTIFTKHLLPVIFNGMQGRTATSISRCWANSLAETIPHLPRDTIPSQILPLLQKRSNLDQTVQTRISTCHLISTVVEFYDPQLIQRDLLPIIKSLCQDIEYDVRWNMCINLIPVAEKIGVASTCSELLPEVVELTNDEELVVKYKALHTIIDIANYVDEDSIQTTILPILQKYIENVSIKHDAHIVEIARVFGKLCYNLHNYLDEDAKKWYLSFYRKLCVNGLTESAKSRRRDSPQLLTVNNQDDRNMQCRFEAAFNFPAVAAFIGSGNFEQELDKTLGSLCADSSLKVRSTIAASFHEIAKLLAPQSLVLEPHFLALLNDEDHHIKATICRHIDITLLYMYDTSISEGAGKAAQSQVFEAIVACYDHLVNGNDWRATADLIKNLAAAVNTFSEELVYSRLYPMIYETIKSQGCRPVKTAACECIAWLLKSNKHHDQRTEMIGTIIKQLARGESSMLRIMYIELCLSLHKQFSKAFFKAHFMEYLLELSSDKVIDVRLRLSKILPFLKSMLKLPGDRILLQKLEQAVRNLLNQDKLGFVNSTIRHYVQLCDQQEVTVESVLDRDAQLSELDLLDARREDEEKLILFNHEQHKKRRGTHHHSSKSHSHSSHHHQNGTDASSKLVHRASVGINPSSAALTRHGSISGSSSVHAKVSHTGSSPSPVPSSIKAASVSPTSSQARAANAGRRGSMPVALSPGNNLLAQSQSRRTPTPDLKKSTLLTSGKR